MIHSHRSIKFVRANRRSPVVYGSVTGPEHAPTGIFYRLADGSTWDLSIGEVRCVGHPRWLFDDEADASSPPAIRMEG